MDENTPPRPPQTFDANASAPTTPYPPMPPPSRGSGTRTILIVLGIVAVVGIFLLVVLAGLMLPALQRARHSALTASSLSDLRVLGLSLAMYTSEHDRFPETDQLAEWLAASEYSSDGLSVATRTRHSGQPYESPLSREDLATLSPTALSPSIVVLYAPPTEGERSSRSSSRNAVILLGDGLVRSLTPNEFEQVMKVSEQTLQTLRDQAANAQPPREAPTP